MMARDGSRTRAEALLAFPEGDPDASPTALRGRFTILDITRGLADDSREADERAAARRLADLRGRAKGRGRRSRPHPARRTRCEGTGGRRRRSWRGSA